MHHEIYTARSALSPHPSPAPGPPAFKARIGRGADLDNLAIYCNQSPLVRRDCKCQRYSSSGSCVAISNLLTPGDSMVGLLPHRQRRSGSRVRPSSCQIKLSTCQVSSSLCARGKDWPLPADRPSTSPTDPVGLCGLASHLAPRMWEQLVLGTDYHATTVRGVGLLGGWRHWAGGSAGNITSATVPSISGPLVSHVAYRTFPSKSKSRDAQCGSERIMT